jgi:hypothetical protein
MRYDDKSGMVIYRSKLQAQRCALDALTAAVGET